MGKNSKNKLNEKSRYHCDGYYLTDVCPSRGGFTYRGNKLVHACNTCGMSPLFNWGACKHCLQYAKYFRPETSHNGQVIDLTPYKAKNSEYVTTKAYRRKSHLVQRLNKHHEEDSHGVDTKSGYIVHATK